MARREKGAEHSPTLERFLHAPLSEMPFSERIQARATGVKPTRPKIKVQLGEWTQKWSDLDRSREEELKT